MVDAKLVDKFVKLGYNERDARFYTHIHTLTEGGTKGIEVFEQPKELLDTIVPRDSPGIHWTERSDIERMFTNTTYRRDYFEFYKNYVLPKLSVAETPVQQKSRTRRVVESLASLVR